MELQKPVVVFLHLLASSNCISKTTISTVGHCLPVMLVTLLGPVDANLLHACRSRRQRCVVLAHIPRIYTSVAFRHPPAMLQAEDWINKGVVQGTLRQSPTCLNARSASQALFLSAHRTLLRQQSVRAVHAANLATPTPRLHALIAQWVCTVQK